MQLSLFLKYFDRKDGDRENFRTGNQFIYFVVALILELIILRSLDLRP